MDKRTVEKADPVRKLVDSLRKLQGVDADDECIILIRRREAIRVADLLDDLLAEYA